MRIQARRRPAVRGPGNRPNLCLCFPGPPGVPSAPTPIEERTGILSAPASKEDVVAATRSWLETSVIGLNLCPFAQAVHAARRIRYFVSAAETAEALREDLASELRLLGTLDAAQVDTTLLIHPAVLLSFPDFNDFLGTADEILSELGLVGVFQIASFHPAYQFAGTKAEDVSNRTNRSPFPTLHLLREASIERAIASHPDAAGIPGRNIETMRRLDLEQRPG